MNREILFFFLSLKKTKKNFIYYKLNMSLDNKKKIMRKILYELSIIWRYLHNISIPEIRVLSSFCLRQILGLIPAFQQRRYLVCWRILIYFFLDDTCQQNQLKVGTECLKQLKKARINGTDKDGVLTWFLGINIFIILQNSKI